MSKKSLWSKQSEKWKNVGSPTRPCFEDETIFTNLAFVNLISNETKKVVVAGVTPELINNIKWPSNVELEAFDISLDMIKQNWNPPSSLCAKVNQCDWRKLPLDDNSVDLIIGDGIFTALGSVKKMLEVLTEFKRILNSNGKIVLRNFTRPENKEELSNIRLDANKGNIENFGTLKWRLATALTNQETSIVTPKEIHSTFEKLFPDRKDLSLNSGWSLDQIATIDSYEEMTSSFYFPTNDEITKIFNNIFDIYEINQGSYEWSKYCPFITLNKKSD